mmetsp:Transcript_56770/g.164399  ORF Transcript_56770/g.164399 Transcript_56770/m.164399 type:complete len:325 (+) Transcript_56770:47-1021(+)
MQSLLRDGLELRASRGEATRVCWRRSAGELPEHIDLTSTANWLVLGAQGLPCPRGAPHQGLARVVVNRSEGEQGLEALQVCGRPLHVAAAVVAAVARALRVLAAALLATSKFLRGLRRLEVDQRDGAERHVCEPRGDPSGDLRRRGLDIAEVGAQALALKLLKPDPQPGVGPRARQAAYPHGGEKGHGQVVLTRPEPCVRLRLVLRRRRPESQQRHPLAAGIADDRPRAQTVQSAALLRFAPLFIRARPLRSARAAPARRPAILRDDRQGGRMVGEVDEAAAGATRPAQRERYDIDEVRGDVLGIEPYGEVETVVARGQTVQLD